MLLHMLIWCLKYFLLLWMLKTFVLLNIFLEAMIRFSIEIKHLYKLENLSNIINVFTVTFDQLNASLFSAHQRGVEALFDAWISDFSSTHNTVFYPFHTLLSWFGLLIQNNTHFANKGPFYVSRKTNHYTHIWRQKGIFQAFRKACPEEKKSQCLIFY